MTVQILKRPEQILTDAVLLYQNYIRHLHFLYYVVQISLRRGRLLVRRGDINGPWNKNHGYGYSFSRGFSFLLAVLLAGLLLCGCSGDRPSVQVQESSEDMTEAASVDMTDKAVSSATAAESAQEEVKITTETAKVGICLAKTGNGDNDRLLLELLSALEMRGFADENIIVKKMTGSRRKQDKQIQECLDENCSLLIISSVSDERIPKMADKAVEAGARAVFINCDPGEDEISRWKTEQMPCVWIGSTYSDKLACQMNILYDYSGTERGLDFNQDGHVGAIIVGGGEEAHAALEETIRDLGSELQILGETDSEDFQEISDYMQQVINEKKKEVELVLCSTEEKAHAAADGVELRHRLVGRDILVIGSDAHEDTCTAIINKLMSGAVFTDFYEQATLAAVAAKDLVEGNQGDVRISEVILKVTEDNAQEILDQLWKARERAEKAETEQEAADEAASTAAAAATADAAAEEESGSGETAAAEAASEAGRTGDTSAETAETAAEQSEAASTVVSEFTVDINQTR